MTPNNTIQVSTSSLGTTFWIYDQQHHKPTGGLKKSRTVLQRSGPLPGGLLEYMEEGWDMDGVVFETNIDDDGPTNFTHAVIFPETAWEDMGRPETITVTIRPGDRLND